MKPNTKHEQRVEGRFTPSETNWGPLGRRQGKKLLRKLKKRQQKGVPAWKNK